MNKTTARIIKAVIVIFFLIILTLSLSLYVLNTEKHTRKILFYYNDVENKIVGVNFPVSKYASIKQEMERLVNVWLLHPKNIAWKPAFGGEAKLDLLTISKENVCYVSLKVDDKLWSMLTREDLDQDIGLLRKTVRFNYPTIKKVIIFINGYEQL